MTNPLGLTWDYEYDPAGNLVRESDFTGREVTYRYDAAGRQVGRTEAAGAVLDLVRDARGRVLVQRVEGERPVEFEYTPAGYLRRAGDGVTEVVYERDALGRPVVEAIDGRAVRSEYDLLGRRVRRTTPSGVQTTWQYTPARQPAALIGTAGARVLDGLLLRRAGRGSYEYDDAGRLVRQTRRTLSGRLLVWTYRWSGHHQLVGATTPDGATWRYVYDPFGRRVAKQLLDQHGAVQDETAFTWDGAELAEQRHTHAGLVTATSWDYHGGTGEPLAQTSRSWLADAPAEVIDTRFHAIVSDLVGTPTELVGPDGRISWYRTESLWGEEPALHSRGGADCPLRFPGQYHDRETGLHYNFHRYYDPATARYLSPDPVGLRPSANHYTYVVNPLVVCDPFGLAGHRGPDGRSAPDPNAPPPSTHNRSTEYPHTYWDSTHDAMATNWTLEGQAQGRRPVDASGVPIPREQLTWVDANGNTIPFDQLTYDHNPAVVQHWNQEGYDQTRAQREAWYNQTDDMEAMTRSENSRRGAQLTERYSDTPPGPNYSCT